MPRLRFPSPAGSEITPESVYMDRRRLLKIIGISAAAGCLPACDSRAEPEAVADTLRHSKPEAWRSNEALTTFEHASSYNNFYEFGTGKEDPARTAGDFKPRPWSVEIAGAAERTGTFALEDLIDFNSLEERVYRLRCVEAWSMVIPWIGIPLGTVLQRFKPLSSARHVAFTTLHDAERMPGQRYPVLEWPYREGLRIDEAMHPLSLLAVGMYGRLLPNQNGAPLRLVVPWKYGFKSIKSIVRIEFTEQQPRTSWNSAAANEYGYYCNVNPAVDHPRWSQASERRLTGTGLSLMSPRIATLPFNGYAEQVAQLYAGMDLARDF